MKFAITASEKVMLAVAGIDLNPDQEYDDDTALELLDKIYEKEIYFAQGTDRKSKNSARIWAQLADKIRQQIPEN